MRTPKPMSGSTITKKTKARARALRKASIPWIFPGTVGPNRDDGCPCCSAVWSTVPVPSWVSAAAPRLVAAAFLGSGVLHFKAPRPYVALVPRVLPHRLLLVQVSGALELVCAAGLLARTRWAGPASAVLLVAVFPANVQMALDSGSGRLPGLADNRLVAWGRLPLQAPLVWAALQSRPRR